MALSLDVFGREGFLKTAKRASEVIKRWAKAGNPVTIISHVDADGITAASIMASCFYKLEVPFKARIVPWLDETVVEELASEPEGPMVFTDIGSSYMEILARKLGTREVLVLDHHPPVGSPPPGWVEVNPHNHGLDGTIEVSGAGVTYLVARELGPEMKELAPLAVIGALGDMQDRQEGRALKGLNEIAVKDAVGLGLLAVSEDLVFYGRETRPIHKAMAYTSSPYIPGVSYQEDNAFAVLSKAGVKVKEDDRWRTVSDLSDEEKRRLLDALAEFLASRGHPPELVQKLVGAVYTLVREEPWTPLRDAREFASLLNACARMERPDLGVAVCMGDRSRGLEEAMSVLEEYRSRLAKCLSKVQKEPGVLEERKLLTVVHGGSWMGDRMVAAVASILSSGMVGSGRVLVVYALEEDGQNAKVSVRGPPGGPDVDLGAIMREVASMFSGLGGGHDVAAGARGHRPEGLALYRPPPQASGGEAGP
ncbi:DHH family phosphoesterase [Candidatus Bathyarchaeota archaeon ex4484_135]|nr:MAG: DHH family phosphoesterase [Candidatus Bathyarchaeota archaeon ex4484_135]